MEDAYVIGIRLALDNGVSEGVAAVRGELAALDRAVTASAAQFAALRRAAASVLLPVAPTAGAEAPALPQTPERAPVGADDAAVAGGGRGEVVVAPYGLPRFCDAAGPGGRWRLMRCVRRCRMWRGLWDLCRWRGHRRWRRRLLNRGRSCRWHRRTSVLSGGRRMGCRRPGTWRPSVGPVLRRGRSGRRRTPRGRAMIEGQEGRRLASRWRRPPSRAWRVRRRHRSPPLPRRTGRQRLYRKSQRTIGPARRHLRRDPQLAPRLDWVRHCRRRCRQRRRRRHARCRGMCSSTARGSAAGCRSGWSAMRGARRSGRRFLIRGNHQPGLVPRLECEPPCRTPY